MAFTCEICMEPAILTQRFRHSHNCDSICLTDCDPNICLANCAPNICLTCLASHIQAKVDDNIASIKCPRCEKTLNPVECRAWIPAEIFVRWCDCRCKSSVSSLGNSYCPDRTCSEMILNECDDTTKICACPRCKTLLCFKCRAPWHAGFSCSESSQEWDSNDLEFGFLVEQRKWTRCPACGQPTERVAGCPFVQCRCGRIFCHNCGATCSELSLHACDTETRSHQIGQYIVFLLMFLFSYLIGNRIYFVLCGMLLCGVFIGRIVLGLEEGGQRRLNPTPHPLHEGSQSTVN